MRLAPSLLSELGDACRIIKSPAHQGPAAQRDPAVIERVSEMLSAIERGGMDAVLHYARELDGWDGGESNSTPPPSGAAATSSPPNTAKPWNSAPSAPTRSPASSASGCRTSRRNWRRG